jgi:cation-transporting P-type ATPase 13A2
MVGVSLSESEASIAAPFTYQRPNIECIPPLLSEGRSSLVTSFQLFRYISMYSLTQFGAAILTYFVGSVLGNWQYLYQDLIIVFPLTIFMGATTANKELSVKRPSAQLTSLVNILGLAGHVGIILSFQVFVFLYTQKQPGYYRPSNPNNTPDAFETTALYYYSNFQYLIIAALFALGRPFKASPLTNRKLTAWWLLMILVSLILLLVNDRWGFWRSDDLELPEGWRREMLFIVAVNAFASCMWELYWYPALVECAKGLRRRGRGEKEGSWFGRRKVVKGDGVKEYYVLRGEFEQNWYDGRGDVRVLGNNGTGRDLNTRLA